jgi:glycosyltransferase involved in cell wall biosynthesis
VSRLRLLLTTDAVGGVWTYSLDLAAALASEADAMVFLAVMGPSPSSEQLTRAAAVPGLQVIETGLPLDWIANNEAEVITAAGGLARLAKQASVDLVQLHSPALATADYRTPVVSVVHSCVATWWETVKGGSLPPDLAWRSALVRQGLRTGDLVITPTRAFARAVQQAYALEQPPLAVHNGRLPSVVEPSAAEPFAFTAGRLWDEGKDIASFDAAAALSSIPFRAAGPIHGPNGTAATLAKAEALGSVGQDKLAELLAKRPIFVSTARYEPFGLSVLEAAQAGCALVLRDNPTFRELWNDAAIFADSAQAVAGAVERLAGDGQERERLGTLARHRAASFTPRATARQMLAHYRSLLAGERTAAA